MFSATAKHIALLLCLCHPMTGLPRRSERLIVTLFAISVLASWLRFDVQIALVHGLVLTIATAMLGPVVATAYALLSAGIDGVAVLVQQTTSEAPRWIFNAWESAGMAAIMWRGDSQ